MAACAASGNALNTQPARTVDSVAAPRARVVCTESVLTLEPGQETQTGPTLPSLSARMNLTVLAPYPHWVLSLEPRGFRGPGGPLPLDRLRVESPGQPSAQAMNLVGTGPAPVHGLEIGLVMNPSWLDTPGHYTGTLSIRVEESPIGTRHGPDSVLELPVEFDIPQVTSVSVRDASYSLCGGGLPGRFVLAPDLEVRVLSNADRWSVRVEGDGLISSKDGVRIPAERLVWCRPGQSGDNLQWTALRDEREILCGTRQEAGMVERIRLALDLDFSDRAGSYRGVLRIVGYSD